MEIIWSHQIDTVTSNKLIKYLEIIAYSNNTIRFRYISKNITEFIEKEEMFDYDINKFEKIKDIIINFPQLEILYLDINQLFIFMNKLLNI